MGVCYIVGASEMQNRINPSDGDLVIAADGGYKHLEKTGIAPDMIIGDFDSAELPDCKNRICFPAEKDDTDMMLCIKYGFEKGYREFKIYGSLGGKRTDHTVANIQSLAYIAEHGGKGFLINRNEMFTVIKNSEIILNGNDGYFSVFAFGSEAKGVSISGGKYPLDNVVLSPSFPLGVSNQFVGNDVKISVKDGCLLIYAS